MLPGRAYGTTTYVQTPHLGPTPPRGPLAHPARAGALGGTGVAAGSVRRERAKRAEEGKSFQKPTIIGTITTGRPTERAALRWRPTATAPLDLPMRPSLSLLLVSVAQGVARDPQASTSETRRAAALAQSKARKKRFIHVWKQNLWASAESRSGVGSERRFAADDRLFILDTVRKHFVGRSHNLTIVDAPCAIISWPRSGCALPCFHCFHREYSHQM